MKKGKKEEEAYELKKERKKTYEKGKSP